MLVDNGSVSDPISFQPRLQSHRACLQAYTPTLQENILYSPARHRRVKRRQTSKVTPSSILNFCRQMKKVEKVKIHDRDSPMLLLLSCPRVTSRPSLTN